MTFAGVRPWWRSARACAQSVMLVAGLARCTGVDMAGPGTLGSNIPAVGMDNGQFGFAVTARDWTFDQSYAPAFASGTLQIGLVVAGYTSGTGKLTLTDAGDSVVFEQSLAGNVAEGNNAAVHGTPPFHVRVTTTSYTGIVSVGISADITSAAASPLGAPPRR